MKMIDVTQKDIDFLTKEIIGCAIEIHRELGPGLLESAYEKCMKYLLEEKGYTVETQLEVPIKYRDLYIDSAYRLDMLVEDLVIVELKVVEKIKEVHQAQLMTYLNFMGKPKGVLINFNCSNIFHEGQKTFVTKDYFLYPKER